MAETAQARQRKMAFAAAPLAFLSLIIVCAASPPSATGQTPYQVSRCRDVSVSAQSAAGIAQSALLHELDAPQFRGILHQCCPDLSNLTSSGLLERLRAEMEVVEVVSGFSSISDGGHWGFTVEEGLDTRARWVHYYSSYCTYSLGYCSSRTNGRLWCCRIRASMEGKDGSASRCTRRDSRLFRAVVQCAG